jgi:hypothetical protein
MHAKKISFFFYRSNPLTKIIPNQRNKFGIRPLDSARTIYDRAEVVHIVAKASSAPSKVRARPFGAELRSGTNHPVSNHCNNHAQLFLGGNMRKFGSILNDAESRILKIFLK